MGKDIAEFDKFSDNYFDYLKEDLGKYGKYSDTASRYKVQILKNILKNEPRSILDFGCGIGANIPYLRDIYKNTKLFGCDVSPKSIEIAKKNYPYCEFNVIKSINDLQIYSNIDCIFISTVLHHIPQDEHENWIKYLSNLLSKGEKLTGGGYIVIFEHNMKNPITKSIVKKSEGDKNATMLNPKYCKQLLQNNFYNIKIKDKEIMLKKNNLKLRYTYFFPWRNIFFIFIERCLFWLPFGAQYYVFAIK